MKVKVKRNPFRIPLGTAVDASPCDGGAMVTYQGRMGYLFEHEYEPIYEQGGLYEEDSVKKD